MTSTGRRGCIGCLYLTREAVEDAIWKDAHCYRVIECVRTCDAGALRKVAEIVGYKP